MYFLKPGEEKKNFKNMRKLRINKLAGSDSEYKDNI